ncbi:chromatin assembly factor 1 subunit B [Toxorhynchites rutilus septentrionalis]|uniref:chromatin assembly factor 1 subunit B n=1 Tax=Toxorhynchites rutilus septentrionalis TaxID=329112 RepID=UPI002479C2CE|nr:chromatin assembly factor 1 subunit B [Toxorhynchites rutilus septentrionalis]
MKCQIPEISWHNRDPVLSVDIQLKQSTEKGDFYRLASGGTDSHVLIWHISQKAECGTISLELAADLTRHQRAVNAVRWSPSGELLASGDDESIIFLWKQSREGDLLVLDETSDKDIETWIIWKILRGHMEDVYDLSWSPNSMYLISGSVDNTAIVWDVNKGKSQHIMSDHKGFVQGVAWDPKNQFLATLSSDRYFRVFDLQSKKVLTRNNKCVLSVPKESLLHGKTVRLFHDDTLQTFFRRLSFSPDGNLIVTPSGVAEVEGISKPLHTTYIYTRNSLKQPAITLPSPDQYTVAVRFCPLYFKLRTHPADKPPVIPLPYRMIFAVATKSSVYLYDTQQRSPFGLISNIHYTRLTDISWSGDGKILIVSSTDGFCSLISFTEGELGEIVEIEENGAVVEGKTPTKKTAANRKTKKGKDDQSEKEVQKEKDANVTQVEENSGVVEERTPTKTIQNSVNQNEKEEKRDERKAVSTESTRKTSKVEAQPIAIRRKPKEGEVKSSGQVEVKANPIEIRRKPREQEEPPQPIAIKRKPQGDKPTAEPTKEEESRKRPRSNSTEKDDLSGHANPVTVRRVTLETGDPKTGIIVKEIPPAATTVSEKIVQPAKEIIIETQKIISSDEKFESPCKASRPATPIAIRRHPRTPEPVAGSNAPDKESTAATPKNGKSATPIATKRQPRCLESNPGPSRVSDGEDAVDTWPIDEPKPTSKIVMNSSPGECDQTEDIKLVISDDEDDLPAPKEDDSGDQRVATTPKTPRRVEFRTLSTPKSKKKLL